MKKSLLFFFMLATLGATAQKGLPSNFHHRTLSNGLEVLVVENSAAPLATIKLAVRNGAFAETAETNGLTHLYEHLFFKTNQEFPTEEDITGRIEELGIVFNANTSDERANYHITLSNRFTRDGLALMNAAVRYPLFEEGDIKAELDVMDAKIERAESNPVHFLVNDVYEKLWGDQHHRKNALGNQEVIFNATPAQLRVMHDRMYVPNNTLLVVSGDVKAAQVMDWAEEIFGDWRKGNKLPTEADIPEFAPLTVSQGVLTTNENAQAPVMLVAFQGPDTRRNPKDTHAGEVLAYMLSQGDGALQQELAEKELVYQVAVGYTTQKYTGPITLFMVAKPQGLQEAREIVQKHLLRWADDDYFTDEQLERARRMLTYQELYGREVPSEIVHGISYWWASADLDFYGSYLDGIRSVTRADVQHFVRDYILNKPNVTGLLLTEEMKNMMNLSQVNPIQSIR